MEMTKFPPWVFGYIVVRVFMDGFEEFFLLPTAWQYVKSLGQTEAFLGGVLASFGIAATISSPLIGMIHDRLGKTKFIIVFSYFLKFIASLVYTMSFSPWCLLAGRVVSGLASGSLAIVFRLVAAYAPQRFRAKAFVLADATFITGIVCGPAISSFLTFRANIFGWRIDSGNSPSFILTIMYFILFVVGLFLPSDLEDPSNSSDVELLEPVEQETKQLDLRSELASNGNASKSTVYCILFQIFFTSFLVAQHLLYLPLFGQQVFHLQLMHVKLLFWINSITILLSEIFTYLAVGHASDKLLIGLSFPLQVISIGAIAYITIYWQNAFVEYAYVLMVSCIIAAPVNIVFPLACYIISKITDPSDASFYCGLCFSLLYVGFVAGRFISGFLFNQLSVLYYSLVLALIDIAGAVWYIVEYRHL